MGPVRVAVTGGLGAGKTSLLQRLQQRGYLVIPEAARAIIADRKSRGLSPRPPPLEFARAILQRDIEQYHSVANAESLAFFDRSVLDALNMLAELGQLAERERRAMLRRCTYHATAFILPLWREIYRTDSERDQSYEDAVRTYQSLRNWYARCGYTLVEVPPGTVEERCAFVLRNLVQDDD